MTLHRSMAPHSPMAPHGPGRPDYRPGWDRVEAMLDGILARQYYTNHGPLAQALEARVAALRGVGHAIAVTNPAIALVMVIEASSLAGSVALSALAPRRCAQAVTWAGLQPRFCDVSPAGGMTVSTVRAGIGPDTSAILSLCEPSDGAAGPEDASDELAALAAGRGLALIRDEAFGEGRRGVGLMTLPGQGDDAGAACILTGDAGLAARLRNIRSSYGAGRPVAVARTANGRLSEAQAAMALLSLETAEAAAAHAARLRGIYRSGLAGMQVSSHGGAVAVVMEWRNAALARLQGAGWPARAPDALDPRAAGCLAAAEFAAHAVLLPAGPAITGAAAAEMCRVLLSGRR